MEDKFVYIDNDLPTNSFNSFDEMRSEGFLCDVTFKIGDRKVLAHRSLLAASSPHFRSMFLNMKSDTMEEITMAELEPDALEALINFSYRCHLEITSENVQPLLIASSFLQMDHVFDACCDFYARTMHPNNVLEIQTFANIHDFLKVKQLVDEYVQTFFVHVSHSEGFLNMPFSDVKELITKDELHVASEELVFQAVMAWVKHSVLDRKDKLPELLTCIRMLLLSVDFLSHIASEDLIRESVVCRDLLDEVKLYHSSATGKSLSSRFITKPRNFPSTGTELGFTVNESFRSAECDNIEECLYYVYGNSEIYSLVVKYFVPSFGRWMTAREADDTIYAADAAVVTMGKKLYVIGGCDSMGNVLDTVQVFDTETGSWDRVSSMNEKRFHAAATALSDKIYVFGGVTGFAEDIITRSVECFCPETNVWTYLPEMSEHRLGACAVTLDEDIYIFGGCGGDSDLTAPSDLKSVERYHPETKEWSSVPELTSELCLRGAVAQKGKIYVHGEKYVEIYDPLTKKWHRISYVHHCKSGFSLLTFGGKLCAVGGKMHGADDTPSAVDIYDPETDEWSEGTPLPECVCFIGAGTVCTSY